MTTKGLMSDRIVINDMEHGRLIGRRSGYVFNPAGDQVIARVRDGRLLGGVIYTSHIPATSIGMHSGAFVTDWVTRDLLWAIFDYPFVQLSVSRVFGQVPESNHHALEVNRKLGFKETARISGVFPCGDLVVVSMHRDECRWLNLRQHGLTSKRFEAPNHGRKVQSSSTP